MKESSQLTVTEKIDQQLMIRFRWFSVKRLRSKLNLCSHFGVDKAATLRATLTLIKCERTFRHQLETRRKLNLMLTLIKGEEL
jgi:hypothetical protein